MIGYWLSPDGHDVEVHNAPPHTHFEHAARIIDDLEAESDDPVRSLLCRGWIRVSDDQIQVRGMTPEKARRISRFVKEHAGVYERIDRVTVMEEETAVDRVFGWEDLVGGDAVSLLYAGKKRRRR